MKMPLSILIPALSLLLVGIGLIFTGIRFTDLRMLLGIGLAVGTAAAALLLGRKWGRHLASLVILTGYIFCGLYLISVSGPAQPHLTVAPIIHYGSVLAVVGLLSMMSGCLWSRRATAFLTAKRGIF